MKSVVFIILFAISVDSIINRINQTDGNLERIARGHDATAAQFPYIVRIDIHHETYTDICGGALIGANWILTAAHCFDGAILVEVYLGSVSIYDADVAYIVPLSNIKLHPRFHYEYLLNDIALVKIPTTNSCDTIGIIPLPKIQISYSTYEDEIGVTGGWGIIDNDNTYPDTLQWGYAKILRNARCQNIQIRPDEMCTAMSPDWATACEGDSGGPLVFESTYELIGIVSSGDNQNCLNGKSVFYTRVTSHLDWIKEVSGIFY